MVMGEDTCVEVETAYSYRSDPLPLLFFMVISNTTMLPTLVPLNVDSLTRRCFYLPVISCCPLGATMFYSHNLVLHLK